MPEENEVCGSGRLGATLGHEFRQSPLILGSVGEDEQPAPESDPLCPPCLCGLALLVAVVKL